MSFQNHIVSVLIAIMKRVVGLSPNAFLLLLELLAFEEVNESEIFQGSHCTRKLIVLYDFALLAQKDIFSQK